MRDEDYEYQTVWNGGPLLSGPWLGSAPEIEKTMSQQLYQFKSVKSPLHGMVKRPKAGSDAQEIGERLEHILRRKGRLTPQVVVDDARAASSPLHDYFEWDDPHAADAYRVLQAKQIIASVYLVQPSSVASDAVIARAFVSVDTHAEAHYEPIATVLSDAAMYAQVCRRAHSELVAFGERYADFFSLKQIGQRAADAVEQELSAAEGRKEKAS